MKNEGLYALIIMMIDFFPNDIYSSTDYIKTN